MEVVKIGSGVLTTSLWRFEAFLTTPCALAQLGSALLYNRHAEEEREQHLHHKEARRDAAEEEVDLQHVRLVREEVHVEQHDRHAQPNRPHQRRQRLGQVALAAQEAAARLCNQPEEQVAATAISYSASRQAVGAQRREQRREAESGEVSGRSEKCVASPSESVRAARRGAARVPSQASEARKPA